MLKTMSSSEYLNYENLKFSKSAGTGIFGNDAIDTGISADIWRFYIYYNRPEKSDFQFMWDDFLERVNSELIGNFSNLINRIFSFYKKNFGDKVDSSKFDINFFKNNKIDQKYENILTSFEKTELKSALKEILEVSALGNKIFQDNEPWKTKNTNEEETKILLTNLIYLIRDLSILISPFIPETVEKIRGFFLKTYEIEKKYILSPEGLKTIGNTEILFNKLEKDYIESLKIKYSGDKKMTENNKTEENNKSEISPERIFSEKVCLKVVKIVSIERNPDATKLFILKLDDGTEEGKQIVSSIADFYSEEELIGKHIIIVHNLKPAKFRGIKSEGMLVAVEDENNKEKFRIIILEDFTNNLTPGERIILETDKDKEFNSDSKINIDKFEKSEIISEDGELKINGINLILQNSLDKVLSKEIKNGKVY